MLRLMIMLTAVLAVAGCNAASDPKNSAKIAIIGDSMFAVNRLGDNSVAHFLERNLDEPIEDRSVIGARFDPQISLFQSTGLNIKKQYQQRPWDWVVMNGGGNDILLGCRCSECDDVIDALVTRDGSSGVIPDFIDTVLLTADRVVYSGYLRTPGTDSLFENCKDAGDKLEGRLERMATLNDRVFFVTMTDIVPSGDTSFHKIDRLHPSAKGSEAIADKITAIIQSGSP